MNTQKDNCKNWEAKEGKLRSIAKGIYKACLCRADGITDVQIDNLDDDVYDMICESCWEKLRAAEDRLFPKRESTLLGAGNSEGRMYVVLRRDDAKPIVSRLLFSCSLRDEVQYLELYEGIQHFKNDEYDIDLITTSDRVYLIVRCDDALAISKRIYEWMQKRES